MHVYHLKEKLFFLDVDECVLRRISGSNTVASLSGCHHECFNYEGGFECFCRNGFLLMYDTKRCQGLVLSLEYDKCQFIAFLLLLLLHATSQ